MFFKQIFFSLLKEKKNEPSNRVQCTASEIFWGIQGDQFARIKLLFKSRSVKLFWGGAKHVGINILRIHDES